MADGSHNPAIVRSDLGERFRASVLRAAHWKKPALIAPGRGRSFQWYLAVFRIALERSLQPLRLSCHVHADDHEERLAREVLGIMREIFTDHDFIPQPDTAVRLLRKVLAEGSLYSAVAHQVIAYVREHLKNAEDVTTRRRFDLEYIVQKQSPRKRELLPDPGQPAWSKVNRMPTKKVQMLCRISKELKALIEDEAVHAAISQSRWLEEAIAEKLQRHGHPIYLPAPSKAPAAKPTPPRRTRRASLPEPSKPRGAAVNRADKATTIRISETLARQIDKARGKKDRSAWLNDALLAFMDAQAELPEASPQKEALPVAVSLRFDRGHFTGISDAAVRLGCTRSEFFRRLARWYLQNNQ